MADFIDNVDLDYEFDEKKEEIQQAVPTIESIIREQEEEMKILKEIQNVVEKQMKAPSPRTLSPTIPTLEEKAEADSRSVYIGNVDYSVKQAELEAHFLGCGFITRVTIPCDKFSGHPKGFAYIEFCDKEGATNALAMTGSLLKGRQMKVNEKRTNTPGISTTNRKPTIRGGIKGKGQGPVVVKYIYVGSKPRGNRTFRRTP